MGERKERDQYEGGKVGGRRKGGESGATKAKGANIPSCVHEGYLNHFTFNFNYSNRLIETSGCILYLNF